MLTLLLFCFVHSVLAEGDGNKDNQSQSAKKNIQQVKEPTIIDTEKLPDKELLLFLSEFSDAQDQWVDPEIFNQPNTETILLNSELEETKNEDVPNNL
ncbi:MAG: hypothetical protein AB8B80_15815 [Marinicellaceae bacterium]